MGRHAGEKDRSYLGSLFRQYGPRALFALLVQAVPEVMRRM
ncbi:hypothetical protein [Streptomyces sp. AV19]|nr:hypothetical protein [Streptomyces sp. AV19]MDG4531873.1 hypothetical protein [Streptomyces sp. AV19]